MPRTSDVPKSRSSTSTKATALPSVITTFVKSLLLSSNVILLSAPALNVAVLLAPLTVKVPLSVIAPPAVIDKSPDTVDAPNTIAPASTNVTLLPEVIATVEKLFATSFKVILLPEPAASVVVPPVDVIVPLSVISPVLVIVSAPTVWLTPVISRVPLLVNEISPLVAFVPLKLVIVLVLVSVVPPTELVVSSAPLIMAEPDVEIVPADVKVILPVVLKLEAVPKSSAKLAIVILPVPSLREIAPPDLSAAMLFKLLLAFVKVTSPPPRSNKSEVLVLRFNATEPCVIAPADARVNTSVAKAASGVQDDVPNVIAPAPVLPMRISAA